MVKKYLTDRREIAEALNFGKYPVLRIDLETPTDTILNSYDGCKVIAAHTGKKEYNVRCTMVKFADRDKYTLMPECIGLHADFGYSDVKEMMEWAQAPVIHENETVVVIEDYPKSKMCRVHMMKVSGFIDRFVYPAGYIEEIGGDENE